MLDTAFFLRLEVLSSYPIFGACTFLLMSQNYIPQKQSLQLARVDDSEDWAAHDCSKLEWHKCSGISKMTQKHSFCFLTQTHPNLNRPRQLLASGRLLKWRISDTMQYQVNA
eukprot:s694_g17.t1